MTKIPKMTHEKKKINYNVVKKKFLYIPFYVTAAVSLLLVIE